MVFFRLSGIRLPVIYNDSLAYRNHNEVLHTRFVTFITSDFHSPVICNNSLGRLGWPSSVYRNHNEALHTRLVAFITSDFHPHEETRNHFHGDPLSSRRLHDFQGRNVSLA